MASNGTNVTSKICVNETEIFLAPLLRWIVPILGIAGIFGNVMILIVFNSSKCMKTKAHLLLSAMAAADLAHTVAAFVIFLYVYEDILKSDTFSRIYHHTLKAPSLLLVNWMAMMSTWLAVSVTIERLIAIGYPLKARMVMRKRFLISAIMGICFISFLTTCYNAMWLRRIVYPSCQDPPRKLYRLYSDQNLWYYGHISRILHSFLGTLIPVILLFLFNAMLVYHLHKNQALIRKFYNNEDHPADRIELTILTKTGSNGDWTNQQNQASEAMIKREYKVAIVVMVISLKTACCLLPSAAFVVFDTIRFINKIHITPTWYFTAIDIINLLIFADKVLDFFLYCLTSGYFRRRLIMVITSNGRRDSNSRQNRGQMDIEGRKMKMDTKYTKMMENEKLGKIGEYGKRPSSTSTLYTTTSTATVQQRRATASSDGSIEPMTNSSRMLLTVQYGGNL